MDSNEKNLNNSLESTMSMTQDEIERFLAEQENQGNSGQIDFNDADLASLLSELGEEEDKDIQEISNLLSRADNNEAVADDVVALMNQQEAKGENAYEAMDLFSDEQQEKKESFLKRLLNKLKKKKKEQPQESLKEQAEESSERDNLKEESAADDSMAEALALLSGGAEVKEESEKVQSSAKKEKGTKKKEKKSKKPKKEKKSADKDLDENEAEQIPEKAVKKKKEKKGKEKSVKEKKIKDEPIREKQPITDVVELLEEEEQEPPHRKKIIMVFVAAVMIMLGFLIVNYYFTRHANKKLAEEAYEAGDYLECYQLMYGQKLNDSQTAMFHRSELTLKMEIFWNHYQEFVANNQLLEGLDRLVQFVYGYQELLSYATEWNCQDTVESTYNSVLNILVEDYKVSEQEVFDIATLKEDVDYTRALVELVEIKKENDAIEQAYPDILPPEKDRITQD